MIPHNENHRRSYSKRFLVRTRKTDAFEQISHQVSVGTFASELLVAVPSWRLLPGPDLWCTFQEAYPVPLNDEEGFKDASHVYWFCNIYSLVVQTLPTLGFGPISGSFYAKSLRGEPQNQSALG